MNPLILELVWLLVLAVVAPLSVQVFRKALLSFLRERRLKKEAK